MKTVFKILTIAVLVSCQGNTKTEKKESVVSIDSIRINHKDVIVQQEKEITIVLPPSNCNETYDDFDRFFERFSKDSIYQKQRIKYPLNESYIKSLDPTVIHVNKINVNEYRFINFGIDKYALQKEYDKYIVKIEKLNSNLVQYYWYGYDNGINITYKFKLIGNCWLLVEILDRST